MVSQGLEGAQKECWILRSSPKHLGHLLSHLLFFIACLWFANESNRESLFNFVSVRFRVRREAIHIWLKACPIAHWKIPISFNSHWLNPSVFRKSGECYRHHGGKGVAWTKWGWDSMGGRGMKLARSSSLLVHCKKGLYP